MYERQEGEEERGVVVCASAPKGVIRWEGAGPANREEHRTMGLFASYISLCWSCGGEGREGLPKIGQCVRQGVCNASVSVCSLLVFSSSCSLQLDFLSCDPAPLSGLPSHA